MNHPLWLPLIITLICIADGVTDGLRRKAKRKAWWHTIYHTWEAVLYAALCAVMAFWYPWYWCALLCLTTRLAFFDPIYNLVMGHSLWYNGEGGAWTDRLENDWKINVVAFRTAYLLAHAVVLFLYFHFYPG